MDYIHKTNFNIVRGRSALPIDQFIPYLWIDHKQIVKLSLPDCPQCDWICKGDKIIEMTAKEKATKKAEIDLVTSNNRHPRLILSQIKLAFGEKRKDFIFDLFNHNPVFLLCMDERYWKDAHYSIDRINNNGNYCKSNCRWVTQKEQQILPPL